MAGQPCAKSHPTGSTQLKSRLLRAMRFELVRVPYFAWDRLDKQARQGYLEGLLACDWREGTAVVDKDEPRDSPEGSLEPSPPSAASPTRQRGSEAIEHGLKGVEDVKGDGSRGDDNPKDGDWIWL